MNSETYVISLTDAELRDLLTGRRENLTIDSPEGEVTVRVVALTDENIAAIQAGNDPRTIFIPSNVAAGAAEGFNVPYTIAGALPETALGRRFIIEAGPESGIRAVGSNN